MVKLSRLAMVAFGAALASTGFTQILINPGGSTLTPSISGGVLNSYNLVAESVTNFVGKNAQGVTEYTGVLDSYVAANSVTGDLLFAWIVNNNPGSNDPILGLSVSHFAGYSTGVGQVSVYNSEIKSVITSRTGGNGDDVDFSFLPGLDGLVPGSGELDPGTNSSLECVFTNAKQYTIGSAQLIDGAVATVPTYCPAPEPAPFAALGLGAVALIRRRKRA